MSIKRRASLLLLLPFLFFGAGALMAGIATETAKLAAPKPVTLLDAAAVMQDEAILRMVSAGEDPGLPVVLKHPALVWEIGDTTSPLLVAIVGGEVNRVAYMAKHTQRLAEPPNDLALCLAARFGHSNIARFLMKIGATAVPKNGCGDIRRPEDIAKKHGFGGLARELRQYRIEAR
jgi:hypothetical protein